MKKSKIAFLVIGNSAPNTLREFITNYQDEHIEFYLHIDEKNNQSEYLRRLAISPNKLNLITNRFPIYWGGFNMIRATIELIKKASEKNPDSLVLLSDDSLPLHPTEVLIEKISAQPNRIDTYQATDQIKERYYNFYYFDSSLTSARWLPAETRFSNNETEEAIIRLKNLREKNKIQNLNLKAGSQWWALDTQTAMKISETIESNIHLKESFEFSAIPDETVFQTLSHEIIGINKLNSPMLTDFTKEPKPYVFDDPPKKSEIPEDKLFIRKVADSNAKRFIEEINSRA